MELTEAIKRRLPLQIRLPDRANPLRKLAVPAAEVFLVETTNGPGVVWLDSFWCRKPAASACHIAYARPSASEEAGRWIDNDPRYGPNCLAYQKPFIIERLSRSSSAWSDFEAWHQELQVRAYECGRHAAWRQTEEAFGELIVGRYV